NGNRARRAYVYFKSEQDKVEAQVTNMYYFNTKLEWHVYPEEAKNKSFTYSQ
ncbi:31958_t:CDS:1, partial [Gigaspora margarita]